MLDIAVHTADTDLAGINRFHRPVRETDDQRAAVIHTCSMSMPHIIASQQGDICADGNAVCPLAFHRAAFIGAQALSHSGKLPNHASVQSFESQDQNRSRPDGS